MSSRIFAPLAAALTISCAGSSTPSSSASSERPPAPPPVRTSSLALTPDIPLPASKPVVPVVAEKTDRERIDEARAALEAGKQPLADAMAKVADKKVTSEDVDRARGQLSQLEKVLAEAKALEAKDAEYAKLATESRAAVDKSKADLEARWLEVGLTLQRAALDGAVKAANQAIQAAKQKNATEETLAKADAAVKAVPAMIERGAPLEPKDAKYAQHVGTVKPQIAALEKAVVDARHALAVRLQKDALAKAKGGVDGALAALRKSAGEPQFEAVKAAQDGLVAALAAGLSIEEKDAEYAKHAATVRATIETTNTEVAGHRAKLKVDGHKGAVEVARKAAADAVTAASKAPASDAIDAADKAIVALETALSGGKEIAAADKKYADYATTVTKEIEARRAALVLARAQLSIQGEKTKLEAALAELESKAEAFRTAPSTEALATAERAADGLEKAIGANAELATKDKAHAALIAGLSKKLADHRAKLAGTKTEQSIAQHKAELVEKQAKVAETLAGLKGKLEYEAYAEASKVIDALSKTIAAGAPVAGANAKYAAELEAARKQVPGFEMEVRKIWIQAADAQVKARIDALAGKPEASAFSEAEKAVTVLSKTVESSKISSLQDKAYLAHLAASEKQAAAYKAQIEARRTGLKTETLRGAVDAVVAAANEAMKGLDGEPADAAFDTAESAVKDLERAIEPDTELATAQPAYVAELKKKAVEHRARIATRRTEVLVGGHRKTLVAAVTSLTEKLAALGSSEDALSPAEEAAAAVEKAVESGAKAAEKDPRYAKELAAAQARVAPARAAIQKKRVELAVAAHKAEVDEASAALAALAGKTDQASLDAAEKAAEALESTLEEGASIQDPKHAAMIAGLKKKLAEQQAAVAKGRVGLKVAAHRAEVDAHKAKVAESLAALEGQVTEAPYKAAEKTVSGLMSVISSGEAVAAEDAKYGAELKARAAEVPALLSQIRRKRVDVALAQAGEKTKAIDGKETMEAAESALSRVDDAIEWAKAHKSPDKAFPQALATAEKQAAAQRALIEKARVDGEVRAHETKLTAAIGAMDQAVAALARGLDAPVADAPAPVEEKRPLGAKPSAKKAAPAKPRVVPDTADKIAERAVDAVEAAVKDGQAVAAKSKDYEKKLAQVGQQITKSRAAIAQARATHEIAQHEKQLESAVAAVTAKLETLTKLEYELYSSAEVTVAALEKVIADGASLGESNPAYAKKLAAASSKIEGYRITIRQKWIAAAEAVVVERLAALDGGKADDKAFKAADDAVVVLGRTVDSGKTLTKAPAFQKAILAAEKQVEAYRAKVDKKRVDVVVDAHRVELDAAEKAVQEKLSALAGKPEEGAFKAAEKAVSELGSTLESGASAAAKDPAYAKRIAALQAKLPSFKATIDKREVEVEVAAHKEKLDEAVKAVGAQLAEVQKSPSAFTSAEQAISALETVVSSGKSAGEKSPAYAAALAAEEKRITGYKARLAQRKTEVEIAEHAGELEEATLAVGAAMKALSGTAETVGAAEEAIGELESAADEGAELAKRSPAHGKRLVAARALVAQKRAAIAQAKIGVEVAAHRKAIEAATAEAEGRIAALEQGVSGGAIKAAETAVSSIESAIKSEAELAQKSPAHAKYLAAYPKRIADLRAGIARRAVASEVAAHQKKVEAAVEQIQERLGALGKLEYDLYASAETAVAGLEKVLSSGESLGERDPAYAKTLAAIGGKTEGYRITIRQKWIEAAQLAVTEKMKALEGKPDDKAFKAADDAVVVLGRTIESGKSLTKAPAYQKALIAAEKQAATQRARIDRRRVELVVEAHAAELAQAEEGVAEAMAAIAPASKKADEASFKAAERAVTELANTIDAGGEAVSKDPAYGKRLAAARGKIAGLRTAIEKRRFDAEVSGNREKVAEAARSVSEKLAALGKGADAAAFDAAESAVGELESALDDGKSFASSNKAYEKELAVHRSKLGAHRARIARGRIDVELAAHVEELDEARGKVTESLAALKGGDDKAFEAAEEAISEVEEQVGEGARFAKSTPAHAKRLAAIKADVPKKRAAIKAARVGIEVAAHKRSVEKAAAEAQARVEGLDDGLTPASIKAAESAVDGLGEALKTELADKGHRAWLAAYAKKVPALRASIGRKSVEKELEAHRREVAEAQGEVEEKIGALDGTLEYDLYAAAETAVVELEKALADGEELAERDARYGKTLAAASAKIAGHRIAIRKKWIDAANAAAVEKLAALDGKPDDRAFKAAEDAVKVLGNTIESGLKLSKAPAYQKMLAASERQVETYKARIDKRRSLAEFGEVRAELDSAVAEAAEKMAAAAKDPEAIDAAGPALDTLADAIDSNTGAAERDPAHKKKLAALRKKLAADRAKLAKLSNAGKGKAEIAAVSEAASGLSSAVAKLARDPSDDAASAVEEAISEAESAIDGKTLTGKAKAQGAALKKKIALARVALNKSRGEGAVKEHRSQLEAQLVSARAAMGGLKKVTDREALSAAESAVDSLAELVASGKDLAKQNKKYGAYLAAARKTTEKFQSTIRAKQKSVGPGTSPIEASRTVDAPEGEEGEDPKARLESAQATAKKLLAAMAKDVSEDTVSSAKVALDDLSDATREAKKTKALAKKVALAKATLAKGRKAVAKNEAKLAKLAAKAAKAGSAPAASSSSDEPEGDAPEGDAESEDPTPRLKSAWSSFAKETKALKKAGKKASREQVDAAIDAAAEVEAALAEGARSPLGKAAKYKKYAAGIKKKLKVEKGKLLKKQRALASRE